MKIIIDKLSIDTDNCNANMNQDEKISMKEKKMNRHTSIFDQALSKYYKNIIFFNMFGLDQLTLMDVGASLLTCPSLFKEKENNLSLLFRPTEKSMMVITLI